MSDLISRKRIEFELCESNMPKKYRDFCRRVINSESLSPSVDAVNIVWHKVATRPLTAEEVAYYAEMGMDGIEYVFDCEMPDDGQEILIATKWGTDKDICSNDAEYGIRLEGLGDWDGVYAWAEMPKYEVSE